MSAQYRAGCALEPARSSPSFGFHNLHRPVQPAADLVVFRMDRTDARMLAPCDTTSQRGPASQSSFETLPVEVVNHILSYLVSPRSRLPGLTETQSSLEFNALARLTLKKSEDLTAPADSDRWATNLFENHTNQHPFHTLSLTSKRCNELVESYCGHLVRACNMFNLPFAQFDKYGPQSVWPDMSGIVYRRLWLQHAPRHCIYCHAVMDIYPFTTLKRLLTNCKACFYAQTLSLDENERQYHLSRATVLASPFIRGTQHSFWFLRVDVEAVALQLYGTRAFHEAHQEQFGRPCSICAITKFTPSQRGTRHKSTQKSERRIVNQRKKTRRTLRIPRTPLDNDAY
ncbi:hypothetical protein HBI40_090050 [Parastagonospora nodorum]|nr:hypothetical protein HBI41_141540 [Parastagonospora nodorum]KAH6291163.1 hypothetical protein HBI40_090050 [Parastagonospora nodorum]